ncbi:MAG: hypothetical protein KAQ98_14380 [Bacteriovoracaceae bacterium]|nr:hypothetical protein [Bacteriovoracaceae bacterium]
MNELSSNSRVVVVGTSGAGKTTFARKLSSNFRLTDIELDALFWERNWTKAESDIFRERIKVKLSQNPGWVIHGNYGKTRHLYWKEATHLVWLDYSFMLIFWRVLRRSISRIAKNEPLWNDNKESFFKTFFSKKSIIFWMFQTYSLRKRQYEELVRSPASSHLEILRFSNPKELERAIPIK